MTLSQLLLLTEKRNERIRLQNGEDEEKEQGGPSMTWEQLEAAQAAREAALAETATISPGATGEEEQWLKNR